MRNYMENALSALAGGVDHFRKNYTGVFPPVNLSEDEEKLYLTAELPGVDPQSLDLSIKSDTLTIKGVKKPEAGVVEATFHRREREAGSFRRSMTLPLKVQPDLAEALFKNGVLTVTLPKAAEARAHQIAVKNQ
jgi:HSP20 family protein